MAGAQFGPDALCLWSRGMKHPPAGIGAVGEGRVPAEGSGVAGTWGCQQLPTRDPVHGAGQICSELLLQHVWQGSTNAIVRKAL